VATRRCVTLFSIWDRGTEEVPDEFPEDFFGAIVSDTTVGELRTAKSKRGKHRALEAGCGWAE
jgi:hypothetical protein